MSSQPTAPAGGGALAAFGFRPEEIAALTRTGTIHSERRGRSAVVFKLRYRMEGRQRVKYLGSDRRVVEQIRAELHDLQAARRRSRRLRRLEVQARSLLRETKLRLETPLKQAGLKFHGRAIRRPRRRTDVLNPTNSST